MTPERLKQIQDYTNQLHSCLLSRTYLTELLDEIEPTITGPYKTFCSFCGQEVEHPRELSPEDIQKRMAAHILSCCAHPLGEAIRKHDSLTSFILGLQNVLGSVLSYLREDAPEKIRQACELFKDARFEEVLAITNEKMMEDLAPYAEVLAKVNVAPTEEEFTD